MKTCIIRITAALILCAALCWQTAEAQSNREAPLTNASIVKLARAGFKENTIIAIIRSRPRRFDLAPDRLIELKKSGVSEKVILAMLAVDDEAFADDGWSDDPFFKDSLGEKSGGKPNGANSVDIFGNSGGSRGRSRSLGTRGGADDQTEAMGSATVRILRPPTEGGEPPKLERTPTLTNSSIIELVEAGFSEGTIIRRIEQSPAEFDLAPDKLKELRRRRVTEPIITAMTAAMSDAPARERANP